jgi:hypothetical protein
MVVVRRIPHEDRQLKTIMDQENQSCCTSASTSTARKKQGPHMVKSGSVQGLNGCDDDGELTGTGTGTGRNLRPDCATGCPFSASGPFVSARLKGRHDLRSSRWLQRQTPLPSGRLAAAYAVEPIAGGSKIARLC